MSPETLAAATGCTLLTAARFAGPLTAAMQRWGIASPLHQAGFLGQIAVESARLTVLTENLNYSAERLCAVWPRRFPSLAAAQPFARNPERLANSVYGGRMGNVAEGDGWRYRGRGLKQLTGRDNYTAYSRAAGVDAVGSPDLLLEPEWAADSAGWFWHASGCAAFAEARDWTGLSKRVNGGTNGLQERIAATVRAMRALGVA